MDSAGPQNALSDGFQVPVDNYKTLMPHAESDNSWWQPDLVLFGEVTGLIVVPIILALYGGKALDRKFDTDPILFVACTILAIVVSTVAIVRISTRYMKQIESETRSNTYDRKHDSRQ